MTKHILLLHGALGSVIQLKPLKKKLEPTYQIHLINFSGHGGESLKNEFSVDGFCKDVLEYLDEKNLEQVNIFGYSMGGFVALHLAKEHPSRVNKIVTLGTKFLWTPEIALKETKMLDPNIILLKVPKFADHLKLIHTSDSWTELLQLTVDMMIELGDSNGFQSNQLSQINHKVLVCLGQLDKMVSLEESEKAVEFLENGKFKLVEDFVHPIEKNDQDKLASILKAFF